jgi:DNA repair exonuclease SbcCD ATPase subunit
MATRESGRGLLDESSQRAGRLPRVGPALERMARDLADARRDLAALTRENAKLRAQLASVNPAAAAGRRRRGESQTAIALTGSWCPSCGLSIDADTVRHETAILAAACCPRCDGRLLAGERAPVNRESSVFLG